MNGISETFEREELFGRASVTLAAAVIMAVKEYTEEASVKIAFKLYDTVLKQEKEREKARKEKK